MGLSIFAALWMGYRIRKYTSRDVGTNATGQDRIKWADVLRRSIRAGRTLPTRLPALRVWVSEQLCSKNWYDLV